MSRFFINTVLVLVCVGGMSQEEPQQLDLKKRDTTFQYREEYGLRVGVDLSRPVLSFTNSDVYQGLELIGDYRLTEKLFIAAELGNEKKDQTRRSLQFYNQRKLY